MEPKTSSLDDIEGRVVADSFQGSSSESDRDYTKYENENEAYSKYENEKEAYSTPPGSTTTGQKMMMIKKKIAIPNPASAASDSKAAKPKRLREEKVDINGSENVIDVSSKRKKAKVAMSITSPVVINVNKPNNKSSFTGITWTDNEEIVILGGLILFKRENRPYKPQEFYRYIKDRLDQGDLTQVKDKVKSLKRKYIRMQKQAQKAQNQMSFANSHEKKGEVKNGGAKNTIIDDVDDKLNKEVKTLVQQQQQPEENSNQIIFNKKEVQVQAQLDNDQKEKDQKMPKKNDHEKNPKEKNDHDHGPKKNDHDHDQKKNPREKNDQIVRDGLRHYLERESIDSRWIDDDDQHATLINLWNNLQLSKVRYDLAISEFEVEVNQRALEALKEFGYENDP